MGKFNLNVDAKELVRSSVLGCLLYVTYISFSNILYFELLTTVLFVFSQIVNQRVIVRASFLFSILVNILNGPQIWHLMYFLIYPFYSYVLNKNINVFEKRETLVPVFGAICSGMVGILLDIPFMLFGKYVTIYYLLSSIKTSVIQGILTYVSLTVLYKPLKKSLMKVIR